MRAVILWCVVYVETTLILRNSAGKARLGASGVGLSSEVGISARWFRNRCLLYRWWFDCVTEFALIGIDGQRGI